MTKKIEIKKQLLKIQLLYLIWVIRIIDGENIFFNINKADLQTNQLKKTIEYLYFFTKLFYLKLYKIFKAWQKKEKKQNKN